MKRYLIAILFVALGLNISAAQGIYRTLNVICETPFHPGGEELDVKDLVLLIDGEEHWPCKVRLYRFDDSEGELFNKVFVDFALYINTAEEFLQLTGHADVPSEQVRAPFDLGDRAIIYNKWGETYRLITFFYSKVDPESGDSIIITALYPLL